MDGWRRHASKVLDKLNSLPPNRNNAPVPNICSASAVKLGIRLQGGYVTETWKNGDSRRKVSALFRRAGFRAPGKSEIVQPPRPAFAPFYAARKDQIVQILTDRLLYKIREGRQRASTSAAA